eukprot:TRINITY_DN73853_c0_g1_i1.p1 TRINITY_DN73853_c0_g1~~TRINITY_DN73853_c0_g1_i1.p1  ORF type:complete len:619 (-),score=98.63 TRINITY_DN73853_c0_g1_i1:37-1893(-)
MAFARKLFSMLELASSSDEEQRPEKRLRHAETLSKALDEKGLRHAETPAKVSLSSCKLSEDLAENAQSSSSTEVVLQSMAQVSTDGMPSAPGSLAPGAGAASPLYLNKLLDITGSAFEDRELSLQDLFEKHPLEGCGRRGLPDHVVLVNFMIDLNWLFAECPSLEQVPCLTVIHGDGGQGCEEALQRRRSRPGLRTHMHAPPLPLQWGTHHSKLVLFLYRDCFRICVRTFNDIFPDFHNKSQAMFVQDFPVLQDIPESTDPDMFGADFKHQLQQYFLRCGGFDPAPLGKYDFSSAAAAVVASVPGYHKGPELQDWGHMRLRHLLSRHVVLSTGWAPTGSDGEQGIVCQCSSFGNFSQRWLDDLHASFAATAAPSTGSLPPLRLVAPTTCAVRDSIEGWVAGVSLHIREASIRGWLAPLWRRWGPAAGDSLASHASARAQAMPHVKSYCRYSTQPGCVTKLGWLFVGSHNLSKSAWGELQKAGTQLCIRSYEVGVLLLPSRLSCLEPDPERLGGHFYRKQAQTVAAAETSLVPSEEGRQTQIPGLIPIACPTRVPPAEAPHCSDPIWAKDRRREDYLGLDRFGAEQGQRQAKFYGHSAAARRISADGAREARARSKGEV